MREFHNVPAWVAVTRLIPKHINSIQCMHRTCNAVVPSETASYWIQWWEEEDCKRVHTSKGHFCSLKCFFNSIEDLTCLPRA
jgi:hypothetical protein